MRVGIIVAARNREYPAVSTSTGGTVLPIPTWPYPNGICAGGNHRSHCPTSPGSYVVREAGSCGAYTGRSSRTRSLSTVNDRSQPIRSAITVAGICGNSLSRSRIRGSTSSTMDPDPARTYRGGCTERTALRTVFLARHNFFAIALIDIRSARYSRRISAQSSTLMVVGESTHAVEVARRVAESLRLEDDRILFAGRNAAAAGIDARRRITGAHDARLWAKKLRKADTPSVVAVEAALDESAWAASIVEAVRPVAVWVVVDASRKTSDVAHQLQGLRRVDAVCLRATLSSGDPASPLSLRLPIALLDGRIPTVRVGRHALRAAEPGRGLTCSGWRGSPRCSSPRRSRRRRCGPVSSPNSLTWRPALVRLLIAIPVAAIMLGLVRAVTHDYGKSNEKQSRQDSADNPLRAEAIAGEAYPQRRTDDPTP